MTVLSKGTPNLRTFDQLISVAGAT